MRPKVKLELQHFGNLRRVLDGNAALGLGLLPLEEHTFQILKPKSDTANRLRRVSALPLPQMFENSASSQKTEGTGAGGKRAGSQQRGWDRTLQAHGWVV